MASLRVASPSVTTSCFARFSVSFDPSSASLTPAGIVSSMSVDGRVGGLTPGGTAEPTQSYTTPPGLGTAPPPITPPTPGGVPKAHAFIGTAEYDPLRDDGTCYAESLSAAGVPVELYNAPTLVHGFVSFALVVPAVADATNRGVAALKAALHRV